MARQHFPGAVKAFFVAARGRRSQLPRRQQRPFWILPLLLAAAAFGAGLPASADADPVIKNGPFTGTAAMRIYLEEFTLDGPLIDRIECKEGTLSGTVSEPPDVNAKVTQWTSGNCTVRPHGHAPTTAFVSISTRPNIEAVTTNMVKFKKPANSPFRMQIDYELGPGGPFCTAEVESGSFFLNYNSSSSTNVLSGGTREFFSSAGSIVPGACLSGGFATFEPSFTFPKPQFEVTGAQPPNPTSQVPGVRIIKPASSSDGTNVRLFGRVDPKGIPTQYYFEYDVMTSGGVSGGGIKVPVPNGKIESNLSEEHQVSYLLEGLKPGKGSFYRLVATNSQGTSNSGPPRFFTTPKWSEQVTPNAAGANANFLFAVDCEPTGLSTCMAVGMSTTSGVDKLLAERRSGGNWALSSPVVPVGSTGSRLYDVSCTSATSCAAVGRYTTGSGTLSLVERWNGSSWAIQSSPNPAGATFTALNGVSCTSTSACTAVGVAEVGGVKQSVVERWNGVSWSIQSISAPSGAKWTQLRSVSCTSTSFCMAVGEYQNSEGWIQALSATWNGSSWSLKTVDAPVGTSNAMLNDVTCTGAVVVCFAGGGYYVPTSSHEETLVERWNGIEWAAQESPTPTSDEATIYGLSCGSPDVSSCTAVGSWFPPPGGGGDYTLAEQWNGSSWSLDSTPNPDEAFMTVLAEVVCRASGCLAVGSSAANSGLNNTTLAQIKLADPEKPALVARPASSATKADATLSGVVTPNGLATQYHFEYGLTTSYGSSAPVPDGSLASNLTMPQSVSQAITGLASGTTYHFRLVASNAEGITVGADQTLTTPAVWATQSTPNPSGASRSLLYDVGCEPSTTSSCTAVGYSTSSGLDAPLAERWNGTSWSEQIAAKKAGATHTRLLGVDCPSTTRCIAVGNSETSGAGAATLGELWNEGKWSVQSTPVPGGATSSELAAVGCSSTASCVGVGHAMIGGVKTAIAERWASPTWTLQSIPIPAGATSSQLDGVDCIWSNFCVAVGRYTMAEGATKSFAIYWNGTWSLQSLTDPPEATQSALLDVSCTPTPNVCIAVGGWKNLEDENNQSTLAYRFNGSSWALHSTPNPPGSTASVLQDVSCATTSSCSAVGSWVSNSGGGSNLTLAEEWNGSAWSIQSSPNPSSSTFSAFFSSSCRGTSCLGVGWSTNASGVSSTLAETR